LISRSASAGQAMYGPHTPYYPCKGRTGRARKGATMDAPIVVCGLGRMGWRLLAHLQAAGLPVVVIDNACRPDDPRLGGARLVSGDFRRRENLEAAGVPRARGVLIVTNDDLVNIA